MIFVYINKLTGLIRDKISDVVGWIVTYLKFKLNRVNFKNDFKAHGFPIVKVSLNGKCTIGNNLEFYSDQRQNIIGRQQKCMFIVWPNAELIIGNNVGISSTAIICQEQIVIEDNVKIGGNVVIYDTDFHSLSASERNAIPESFDNRKTKPVCICFGAFIGSHSTILKGVRVGVNSIVGAGSVVTKDIPDNEIWAGNPAVFIKINNLL